MAGFNGMWKDLLCLVLNNTGSAIAGFLSLRYSSTKKAPHMSMTVPSACVAMWVALCARILTHNHLSTESGQMIYGLSQSQVYLLRWDESQSAWRSRLLLYNTHLDMIHENSLTGILIWSRAVSCTWCVYNRQAGYSARIVWMRWTISLQHSAPYAIQHRKCLPLCACICFI